MPRLYEYFGLILIFYANEHEPVHVHAKCQGREARAEFVILDGAIAEIRFGATPGRARLTDQEMRLFREITNARADDIVQKWIDYFVFNKSIQPERITRRLK